MKITFEKPASKAFVSMTVKNAFGTACDVQFSGKNYFNVTHNENILPRLRDVTVEFKLKNTETEKFISVSDIFEVRNSEGYGVIRFGEKASRGDIKLSAGDRLTVVFEPNGLAKLYVNGNLSSSSYNADLGNCLAEYEITPSEGIENINVIARALSFKEI